MAADFADGLVQAGAAVPVPERQAAVVLHSLAPGDRDWLLERLPPARRAGLQRLIDELAELGVPAQPALVRAACAAPRSAAAAVGRLPAARQSRLLGGEPDGLILAVLRTAIADDGIDLGPALGDRGRRLHAALGPAAGPCPPSLAAALAEVVSRAAAEPDSGGPLPGPPMRSSPAWWRRVAQRLPRGGRW